MKHWLYCRFYKILVIFASKTEHLFDISTCFSTNLSRLRRDPVAPMRCHAAALHRLLWATSGFWFCPFFGTVLFLMYLCQLSGEGLWSMGGPLSRARPCAISGPEPGILARFPGSHTVALRPAAGSWDKGRPMRGRNPPT